MNSWLELACVLPFEFVCACPEGYEPDESLMKKVAAEGAGTAKIIHDPITAVAGADAIYADVWASMGQKVPRLLKSVRICNSGVALHVQMQMNTRIL